VYCGVKHAFLDGYCSAIQGLLDWFEVDSGFTKLLFIRTGLCVVCVLEYSAHSVQCVSSV